MPSTPRPRAPGGVTRTPGFQAPAPGRLQFLGWPDSKAEPGPEQARPGARLHPSRARGPDCRREGSAGTHPGGLGDRSPGPLGAGTPEPRARSGADPHTRSRAPRLPRSLPAPPAPRSPAAAPQAPRAPPAPAGSSGTPRRSRRPGAGPAPAVAMATRHFRPRGLLGAECGAALRPGDWQGCRCCQGPSGLQFLAGRERERKRGRFVRGNALAPGLPEPRVGP